MQGSTGRDGGGEPDVRGFLDGALRSGVIDKTVYYRLVLELQRRTEGPAGTARAEPASYRAPNAPPGRPSKGAVPQADAGPKPSVDMALPPIPPAKEPRAAAQPIWWKEPEPAPESPSRWTEWVGAVRELLGSELAVHGLAYLGVLLTFVGAFGFVAFAYGELDRSLRPLAEAVVPLVCFLTAWFLRWQRAPMGADGLELLGGLILPLVAYASFVDDGPVPPDLVGMPLIAVLALVSLALSGVYAAWTVRHPASSLRYLVAPMGWQVVWALGLVFAGDMVAGSAIRTPNVRQMTAYTIVVVASIAAARAFPARRLARATRIAAIVGLPLGYSLTLAIGFARGWEALPAAVTGGAVVVGIDLLAKGASERTAAGARLAQSAVVAFTAAALLPDLDLGWTGLVVTISAIALLERWAHGRPLALELAVALAELAGGLAMATTEPWAAVVAFGVASIWAHVRRVFGAPALHVPPRSRSTEARLRDAVTWLDAAAVLLPLGVAYGLWGELGADAALTVSAAVLAAAALAYRLARLDRVASLWLVASASCLGLLTIGPWIRDGASDLLVVSAGMCAAVIIVAATSAVVRIWLGAAGVAWTAFLGMELGGLTLEQRALVWAGGGLAVVVAGAISRSGAREHSIALGQVAVAGAVGSVVFLSTEASLVGLSAWTLGWLIEVVSGELRGRSESALGRAFVVVGPLLLLGSLPILVVDAARFAGLLEGRPGAVGPLLAATALVEAVVSRATERRRPLAQLIVAAAFATSLVAIGTAGDQPWPTIAACIGVIAVVMTAPASLRVAPMVWAAWLVSSALTLLVAQRAGVPDERLFVAGFIWSAVVLLGGLALDERIAGRRVGRELVRVRGLVPAATLGAAGVLISLGFGLRQPSDVYAWWMLAGGAVYLCAALLLRIGAVSLLAWALAAFGAGSLLRQRVIDEPWLLIAGAVVPLVAASMLAHGSKHERWQFRWDLPPLVVAHAMVVLALRQAALVEELAPTWLSAAAWCVVVATYLRRWPWAVAAGVLAAIGAWDLGPGWLAAVLAVDSAAAWIAASRSEGDLRQVLQITGVALVASTWWQTGVAIGWSIEVTLRATALVAGAQVLVVGCLVRMRRLAPDWNLCAAALASVGIGVAAYATLPDQVLTGDAATQGAVAVALALSSVAAGVSAGPCGLPRLRETSGILAAAALGEALLSIDASPTVTVAVLVAAGVGSLVVALVLWRTGAWRSWAPAIGVFTGLVSAASPFVAVLALPDRSALIAALLVCGMESAAAGLVLRRAEPLVLSPLLLSAGWIVFTRDAFAGDPQWFTVPLGLAILAVVEVLRWDLRRRGRPVNTAELVGLEVAGFAFLIGASPVRLIQGSSWAGAVGVAVGVLVAAWGALTRVRRRVWLGVAAAVGSPLLMVIVPLVEEPPEVAGATLWVLLAGVGLAVVVVASALERWRALIGSGMHRLEILMRDWD